MSSRSTSPDPQQPAGTPPFGGLGAGLDFFQQWMKAASSAMPGMGSAATQGATAWAMPTLDPEELDKRIQELKTVQFWLEQNARMLGMTIQTLEVQRMTLETLKGMKVPMEALRESLKAQVPFGADAASAAAQPPSAEGAPAAGAAAAMGVNPMQWWSTLTEQFSTLATQAVQASQDAMNAAKPAGESAGEASSSHSSAPGESSGSDAGGEAPGARPRAATQTTSPRPGAAGGKTTRR